MRFKSLAELKRSEPYEVILASLPEEIRMTDYAWAKAFKISELVREIHGDSYEWYGYTLGSRDDPELISDIGLPRNDENIQQYTRIGPENIAAYQESLPGNRIISGWIHSHGELDLQEFSSIDAENQEVALDYVTSLVKRPVAKKELVIRDLALLVEGKWGQEDLETGSVSLITDVPVAAARIMETVYYVPPGFFSLAAYGTFRAMYFRARYLHHCIYIFIYFLFFLFFLFFYYFLFFLFVYIYFSFLYI